MMRFVGVVILGVVIAGPGVARADAPADEPAVAGQRAVGLGAELGVMTGLGASVHVGTPDLGVYVAAGVLPVFVFGNMADDSRSLTFDVYRAFAVNADLYAMVSKVGRRTHIGIAGGYAGNTLLGSGVNLGVTIRYDVSPQLAFTLFGGFAYLPDAKDNLIAHGYPASQQPSLIQLQTGANLGLVFYP